MKLPKFLLCENPIADKSDGRVFILYTGKPKILAEVFHFENKDAETFIKIQEFASQFEVGVQLDYPPESIVLAAVWIKSIDVDINQEYADKLAKIMRRMADWYEAYLIWEDDLNVKQGG